MGFGQINICRIRRASSLVEVLLAVSIFALIITGVAGVFMYGQESGILSGGYVRANLLAQEGIEALRSLRGDQLTNLSDGIYGLNMTGNQWSLAADPDSTDGFTREVIISTVDTNTKIATVKIDWQQNLQRTGAISASTYLTNWQAPTTPRRGGILVYSGGGTSNDSIRYKLVDADGTWNGEQSAADIDGTSTNRHLRSVRIFSSPTRSEKVIISRHYNGTTQYIYAQVWDGSNWGHVQLLANWNATTFLDVQNFDGTYLANGDFMAIYSDNSNTPKSRVWNGSSWSSQVSMRNIGGIPLYIVSRQRPGTNEVMAVFFDQSNDTNSVYFNGGSYATGSWTLHSEHASQAPSNTRKHVDFSWSRNTLTKGALVYANGNNDRSIELEIWTANGSGGGSWSARMSSANQASNTGALSIDAQPGGDEFVACDKDTNSTPRVVCYQATITPSWSAPTNNTVAAATDTGTQQSFDISFESQGTGQAIGVYSDGTTNARLKVYSAASNTWDANPISIGTLGGSLETVRTIPQPDGVDIVILMGNTNQDVYSIVWDGANHQLYSAPEGKALTTHGTNGPSDTDFWFDFAWDEN